MLLLVGICDVLITPVSRTCFFFYIMFLCCNINSELILSLLNIQMKNIMESILENNSVNLAFQCLKKTLPDIFWLMNYTMYEDSVLTYR